MGARYGMAAQLAGDGPDEEPEPETRDATATTVGAMKKVLHEYLETQMTKRQ